MDGPLPSSGWGDVFIDSVSGQRISIPVATVADGGGGSGFGYYISDEAAKAKVNAGLAGAGGNADVGQLFAGDLSVAPRFGVEKFDFGMGDEVPPTLAQAISGLYAFLSDPAADPGAFSQLTRPSQLGLLLGGSEGGSIDGSEIARRAAASYPDLTASSHGLLVDMKHGGFKADLTTMFNDSDLSDSYYDVLLDADRQDIAAQVRGFAQPGRYGQRNRRSPSYRYLRDFHNLYQDLSGSEPGIRPRVGEGSNLVRQDIQRLTLGTTASYTQTATVAPILVHVGMEYGAYVSGGRLHITASPVVALWNPYDVRLLAEDYLVELAHGDRNGIYASGTTIRIRHPDADTRELLNTPAEQWWDVHIASFDSRFDHEELIGAANGTYRLYPNAQGYNFRVGLEQVVLEPGEIAYFSLQGNAVDYNGANGRILTRGLHGGYYSFPVTDQSGITGPQNHILEFAAWQTAVIHETDSEGNAVVDEEGDPVVLEERTIDIGQVNSLSGNLQMSYKLAGDEHRVFLKVRAPANELSMHDALTHEEALYNDDLWQTVQYLSCWRASAPTVSVPLAVLSPGSPNSLIDTAWRLVVPEEDLKFRNASARTDTGIKLLTSHSPRARASGGNGGGWTNTYGWGIYESPTYILYATPATTALFDPDRLWDQSAITGYDNEGLPQYRVVLFHIPRQPLSSIGQFQHLDFAMSGYEPAYVIGNSHASPWIAADATFHHVPDFFPTAGHLDVHDKSYLLNNFLFDRYFFSTLDQSALDDEQISVANNRLVYTGDPQPEARPLPHAVAAGFLVDGPFNVNSTSVAAWEAVLSGLNQSEVTFRDAVSGDMRTNVLSNPFSRSPVPNGDAAGQPDSSAGFGQNSGYWHGHRSLSDRQIRELATAMVEQVKQRGPFTDLGHFINRSLLPESHPHALAGAIQAAIDIQSATSDEPINPAYGRAVVAHGVNGYSNLAVTNFPEAGLGLRHKGAPGYLMQADVLSPIAPFLTTRGDTFSIRSRGEVRDPVSGEVISEVVAEAVVQRLPDYVDPSEPAVTPFGELNAVNEQFGRRFAVVSFRWIDLNEGF